MHVGDVLSKALLDLSHSESPDTSCIIDFWDRGELYTLW
jgi:hypothetical protein